MSSDFVAIRRAFGLEAAQLAHGHSSARVTDAVYAERDGSKVAEIMRRVGQAERAACETSAAASERRR